MVSQATILIVDRSPGNREVLERFLTREGYRVRSVTDIEGFETAVKEDGNLKLALVDIAGFGRSIWDCCEHLRERGIPFLVISPSQSAAFGDESYVHGAQGVMTKPLSARDLLRVVKSLVRESA